MELPNLSALRIASEPIGGVFRKIDEEGILQWHPGLRKTDNVTEESQTLVWPMYNSTKPVYHGATDPGQQPIYKFETRDDVAHINPKVGVAKHIYGLGAYTMQAMATREFVGYFTGEYMYKEDVKKIFTPDQEATCFDNYAMAWTEVAAADAFRENANLTCRTLTCMPRLSSESKFSGTPPPDTPSDSMQCNVQFGRNGVLVDVGALLNHSPEANCETEHVLLRFRVGTNKMKEFIDRPAIAIFTRKQIDACEHLTLDYGYEPTEQDDDPPKKYILPTTRTPPEPCQVQQGRVSICRTFGKEAEEAMRTWFGKPSEAYRLMPDIMDRVCGPPIISQYINDGASEAYVCFLPSPVGQMAIKNIRERVLNSDEVDTRGRRSAQAMAKLIQMYWYDVQIAWPDDWESVRSIDETNPDNPFTWLGYDSNDDDLQSVMDDEVPDTYVQPPKKVKIAQGYQ